MKKLQRVVFVKLLPLLVAISVSSGCATYKSLMLDYGNEKGWTKDKQYAAYHYSPRVNGMLIPDGQGGFTVNSNFLSIKRVAETNKTHLEDLDYVLDYNNSEWAPYIKHFGLREHFERQEEVAKTQYTYLHLAELYQTFKDYMGYRSYYRPRELDEGFNPSSIFVENVTESFPFTSDMVEEARNRGTLREVGRFVWSEKNTLGIKAPDPDDPEDPNKFIWRALDEGIEFVSYKITDTEVPRDNYADYIEGTRLVVTKSGDVKREKGPALKLFVASDGYSSVLVIDKDKEGEIGHILPDFVEKISRVRYAKGLMQESVLSKLFYEPEKQKRIPPKDPPPITVEIAPVGKNKINLWEENAQGWLVPFKYKNERADNFSVAVKIKGDENSHHDPSSPNKQVEYFKKTWTGNGNVAEYFYPQSPFDQSNVLNVSVMDKRVVLVTNDGREVTGYVTPGSNTVIKDNPYSAEYDEGEKRWLLMDEDGDGKYEKKKQVSR